MATSKPVRKKKTPAPPEPATSLKDWIVRLQSTPSGRLMLTNILHAFRTHRFSGEELWTFFEAICAEWGHEGGRGPATLVEAIADGKLADFLCHEAACLEDRCSRVTDDKTLVSHNIDYTQLQYAYTDDVPPGLLELLESGLPEGAAYGEVRGRRPFAWVTRTDELEKMRSEIADEGELAATVRDRLGLSHYSEDHLLIEIQYPEELRVTLFAAAPTFLEGGAGVIFRARAAGKWGRAVDLRNHADGLPEAVHLPIKFTSAFRIRRIGRITRSSGFSFAKVVEGAEYPWTEMPEDLSSFINQGHK